MPKLIDCVVVEGKIYCYDATADRCVEAELTPKYNSSVPEAVKKLIMMKRFDLVERKEDE